MRGWGRSLTEEGISGVEALPNMGYPEWKPHRRGDIRVEALPKTKEGISKVEDLPKRGFRDIEALPRRRYLYDLPKRGYPG